MRNLFNRAQISIPTLMLLGSSLVGSVLYITNIEAKNESNHSTISNRVTALETVTPIMQKDIDSINGKLDLLLQQQGISKLMIDRYLDDYLKTKNYQLNLNQ